MMAPMRERDNPIVISPKQGETNPTAPRGVAYGLKFRQNNEPKEVVFVIPGGEGGLDLEAAVPILRKVADTLETLLRKGKITDARAQRIRSALEDEGGGWYQAT